MVSKKTTTVTVNLPKDFQTIHDELTTAGADIVSADEKKRTIVIRYDRYVKVYVEAVLSQHSKKITVK